MRIMSETVHKFLKAQNEGFSAFSKVMRGLVEHHVTECEYSKSTFMSLRQGIDIHLLFKTSQKAIGKWKEKVKTVATYCFHTLNMTVIEELSAKITRMYKLGGRKGTCCWIPGNRL